MYAEQEEELSYNWKGPSMMSSNEECIHDWNTVEAGMWFLSESRQINTA